MTEKDLGTKLSCQNCEAKFYDLKKKTPVCPKCDTEYVVVKPRTRRAAAKGVVEAPAPVAETPANDDAPETDDEVLKELEVEVEDDDDDDEDSDKSLMEDTSDMDGDDDEDVAGVIGNFDPTATNNDN